MKQRIFVFAVLAFMSLGLATDTSAGGVNDELNSSVSENLKALTGATPRKQCWVDYTQKSAPCANGGQEGCALCDALVPPGPFPPI